MVIAQLHQKMQMTSADLKEMVRGFAESFPRILYVILIQANISNSQSLSSDESVLDRLRYLTTWSPICDTVWGGLGGAALMGKMCHWRGVLKVNPYLASLLRTRTTTLWKLIL